MSDSWKHRFTVYPFGERYLDLLGRKIADLGRSRAANELLIKGLKEENPEHAEELQAEFDSRYRQR